MRKFLIAAIALLVLTNLLVLVGVAYNRSGEPRMTIELTERELPVSYSYTRMEEDSSVALKLAWQSLSNDGNTGYPIFNRNTPDWLDEKKLEELEFDLADLRKDKTGSQRWLHPESRSVVVVLEYDGESYRKALELAGHHLGEMQRQLENSPDDERVALQYESAQKRLTRIENGQSRLYAVDVGIDIDALMQQYSSTNHLFLKGTVGLSQAYDEIRGYIRELYPTEIHVPLPYAQQFKQQFTSRNRANSDRVYQDPSQFPPRYRVRLNLGQRLEPWIESVSAIE